MGANSIQTFYRSRFFWLMLCCACNSAQAGDRLELGELVVTGQPDGVDVWSSTRNATVITREEIEGATSGNIAELLSREAGINLRSLFGNDKSAGVDIRGMGDTYTSNVIILIDGVRLNAPDLSGADLSSIALNEVERIEILRGNGVVRYGDGAIGGVVNIITRATVARSDTTARVRYGSFDTKTVELGTAIGDERVDAGVRYSRHHTDGFRQNSEFRREDVAINANARPLDALTLSTRLRFHQDEYGLPGPVSEQAMDSERGRRTASNTFDGGETYDRFWQLGAEYRHPLMGEFAVIAHWRNRENPYLLGYSPLLASREVASGAIEQDSRELEAIWQRGFEFESVRLDTVAGIKTSDTDYGSFRNGFSIVSQSTRQLGELDGNAWFVDTRLQLGQRLSFSAGYRKSRLKLDRNEEALQENCVFPPGFPPPPPVCSAPTWNSTTSIQSKWKNHALELGVNLQVHSNLVLYANSGRAFRNPNVDELAFSAADLGPQISEQLEIGARLRWLPTLESTLAVFRIESDDEILFDGLVNRNAEEPTSRRGVELEVKAYPLASLYLWGSYSYVDARLEDSNHFIPLVPMHSLKLGAEWQLRPDTSLAVMATHVGASEDGNDYNNSSYSKLDSYRLVDLKARLQRGRVELSAGINNLFNAAYATTAFSGTYYPMPARSAWIGMQVSFN